MQRVISHFNSDNSQVSREDFGVYFYYKTFDVLTTGKYKRWLTTSKENGDAWALNVHTKQNKVQQSIRHVQSMIADIGKSKLGQACKNVINCAQPPVRIFMGFSKCYITQVQSDKCLDISKSGKKNHDMHIHPKFAYFFLFLWYICKMDYVIRAWMKNWHEGLKSSDGNMSTMPMLVQPQMVKDILDYKDIDHALLAHAILENNAICDNFFDVFERAYEYVCNTLRLYDEEFREAPILQPPESYWNS